MANNKLIQVVYTRKLTKDESVSIKVVTDNTDIVPDVISILMEYTLYLTPNGIKETKLMQELYRKSEFTSTSFKRAAGYFTRRDDLLARLQSFMVENNDRAPYHGQYHQKPIPPENQRTCEEIIEAVRG